MQKICMGCMERYDDEFEICPSCGYIDGTAAEEALHMAPGTILLDRYIVGKVLGFGGFGVTYIGYDAVLEQKVAIKEYLPSEFSTRMSGQAKLTIFDGNRKEQFEAGLAKFVDEAKRLAKFHSADGIVKIFDSFQSNNTAYIVMECLDGETLGAMLKRSGPIHPEKAVEMLLPIIRSLQDVHGQGVIHRDIAPDNIFLTNDKKVKLIDFGAARYATTAYSRSLTVIIKPGYSPEEQYRSRGDQGSYTDVYAIGATLYRMIAGQPPPDALERRAHFESSRKDILKPLSRFTPEISENLETAIHNALNVRVEDRTPDMATLEKELTSLEPAPRRDGKISMIDPLKWPRWAKIGIPAALFAAMLFATLLSTGATGSADSLKDSIYIPEGSARVPSVVNDYLDSALIRLDEASLNCKVSGKEYSNLVPANMILSQSINAGTVVPINTTLELLISSGSETRTVPDVYGMEAALAQKALEDAGFEVIYTAGYSDVIAEGRVISLSAPSEAEAGSAITIVVSSGVDPLSPTEEKIAQIPDLSGLEYSEAIEAARAAGFHVGVVSRQYDRDAPANCVISQSIEAGAMVMSGNAIDLKISMGFELTKVPDAQYKKEDEAFALLMEQGLTPKVSYEFSSAAAEGLVIRQDPESGASAEPGSEVLIVVSIGAASFEMPDVKGLYESQAKALLEEIGLSVTISYETGSSAPEGTVIRSSIDSKSGIARGDSVTLAVASSKDLSKVPNVVGRSAADAKSLLQAQGLSASASEASSDTIAKGSVISQSLPGGSFVPKGTTVAITVSNGAEPVKIPNLEGESLTYAQTTLKQLGFTVTLTYAKSASVDKGIIISQNPKSGSGIKGSVIALLASAGKDSVYVIAIQNIIERDASMVLGNMGFNVEIVRAYSDKVPEGYVISQSPEGNSLASKGDTVTLTVSLGKSKVDSGA
ncbi:MAG: PASTA domain-containing protein [Clostridiales bacterium]|jgi:beta-lactam-binding protein with PASTA domain/predicted Ser/Thr protein kinase|nr:PASTA domain-containing protein [Clostridiales bacterium]